MVAKKLGRRFLTKKNNNFKLICNPKHLENNLDALINLYMAFSIAKINPKT
jgi:hypothetical protein